MVSESFLLTREKMIIIYKRYEKWIMAVGKYLLTAWMLGVISQKIGYVESLTRSHIITAIALFTMILPMQWILVTVMGIITVHLAIYDILLGAIVGGVLLVVYVGFVRLYPKESVYIVLTMLAYSLRLEYALPILVGLLGNVGAMMAMVLGIIAHHMVTVLGIVIQNSLIKGDYFVVLNQVVDLIVKNTIMSDVMLGTIIIFMGVFIIVNFIKKQSIDYAPYIAIIIGGIVSIVGFTMSMLFLQIEIDGARVVMMTGLSVLVGSMIQYFRLPLDYARTENVRFEDENHVYFVKVVPKVRKNASVQKVEQVFATSKKNREEKEEAL